MKEITVSKKLFGGKVDFVIYNVRRKIVDEIMGEVYLEGLRLQKIFNMYDSDSELSLLNKLRKMKVSNDLVKLLKKSIELSKLTEGSYDVSLGQIILLRKKGKCVFPDCCYKDILIDGNDVTLINTNAIIDLGSVAKGYIVDRLAKFLEKMGIEEFLIDARGDICVRGKFSHVLGIQNPREKGNICSVKLENQAIATSGDYNQYVKNFEMCHIVNQKNIVSVSVVTSNLEDADAYATAIFTASENCRKEIINSNKEIKVLIIEKDGNLKMLNGFEHLVYKK